MKKIDIYIIVGSSRGLGAALVNELLKTDSMVIGIARTPLENIKFKNEWIKSSRYKHIAADISSENSPDIIKNSIEDLKDKKICVIFNAAYIKNDVFENGSINFRALKETNDTGVTGLCNTIEIFEDILKNGGILAGISSFSVYALSSLNPKISYPATKIYLDNMLEALRALWRKQTKIVTVHLGYMKEGDSEGFLSGLMAPSYSSAAKNIINGLISDNVPDEINFPLLYTLFYKYISRLIPGKIVTFSLNMAQKFLQGKKESLSLRQP